MNEFDPTKHPRNVVDGRWSEKQQTAPELRLGSDGLTDDARRRRREQLLAEGMIPAVSGPAEADGLTTRNRDIWWTSHLMRAEYRADGSGYPLMPDDFTPSQGGGQAISGKRRTNRQKYEGHGVAIRMPSWTSIHAYSNEVGGTFDVAVTGEYPGGQISGIVRVTRHSATEWSVQGLNFPAGDAAQVTEAVSAVLESRRPRTALSSITDLRKRRADRLAAAGVKLEAPPYETPFSGAGYDPSSEALAVKVKGRVYGYRAGATKAKVFAATKSIGHAFNALKGKAARVQAEECGKCNRVNFHGSEHRCPSRHLDPVAEPIPFNLAARSAVAGATR